MDDFDYSVHISDQDWECFFVECEACDLLPPSLAGVDDSGMSDMDDTGSIHTHRALKVDPTAGFLEPNCPIDGPPDCEGSPVDVYLSKYGFGGMENVLSGSEEDIHLQSVNTFFERLKSLTEAEKHVESGQVGAGESREGAQGEELCGDGRPASNSSGALPKNIPKLNSAAARSETAIGKETAEPVATISNINTMKKDEPESRISPRPAANNAPPKTNKSAHPETEPCIRQEACIQTAVNEVRRQSRPHESPDRDVCSGVRPKSDKRITSDRCGLLGDDAKQGDLLTSRSIDHAGEGLGEEDRKSDILWFDSEPRSTQDKSSQEPFPSPCSKKKRRRKKRASAEPSESEHGYKRSVPEKQGDSEEECTRMGRIDPCLSVENNLSHMNESGKIDPTHLAIRNSASQITAKDYRVNDLSQHIPQDDVREKAVRQRTQVPGSARARAATPTSQTNHSIRSDSCGDVATNPQTEESVVLSLYPGLPVPCSDCMSGKSGLATETGSCEREDVQAGSLRQSHAIHHPLTCREMEQNPKSCAAEVESGTRRFAQSDDPEVEGGQDEGSASKSLLAVPGGNFGSNDLTMCDKEAEHAQQRDSPGEHALPLSETVTTASDTREEPEEDNNVQQSRTRPGERQTEAAQANIKSDTTELSPDTSERNKITAHQHSEKSPLRSGEMICSLTENSRGEIEPATPPATEKITDTAGSSCSLVCLSHLGGQGMMEEEVAVLRDTAESVDGQITGGAEAEAEAGVTASRAEVEQAPDSKHSVFAMSLFWSEMEKLTINDILGARTTGNADTHDSLSPVPETETPDTITETDSGFFNQLDEVKPEETTEDTPPVPDIVISSSCVPTTAQGVTWESEPDPGLLGAGVNPELMMLTPLRDFPQPLLAGRPGIVRKISKNMSMRDLHALDSTPLSSWRKDSGVPSSSSVDSYKISLADIFTYFFGQKESTPSQSDTGNLTSSDMYGNSVPETYDHFFSDFDRESLFSNPLTKDEPMPILSSSRSTNTNLQFPEAYEYFFASSSSSDNSSTESDEEEDSGPIRVVSRFSSDTNPTQISSDVYEDFFSDTDFRQNLFWKSMFSFRNVHFMSSVSQRKSSNVSSLWPREQQSRNFGKAIPTVTEPFQELLLFHLEDRISRQLTEQRLIRNEVLQTAVSNPRLDASMLPLKQSDMCLVCIAFASWVLKTANPQVGDAWKAVLLANVSALSAIRYLRKHKRATAATMEEELHQAGPES